MAIQQSFFSNSVFYILLEHFQKQFLELYPALVLKQPFVTIEEAADILEHAPNVTTLV